MAVCPPEKMPVNLRGIYDDRDVFYSLQQAICNMPPGGPGTYAGDVYIDIHDANNLVVKNVSDNAVRGYLALLASPVT